MVFELSLLGFYYVAITSEPNSGVVTIYCFIVTMIFAILLYVVERFIEKIEGEIKDRAYERAYNFHSLLKMKNLLDDTIKKISEKKNDYKEVISYISTFKSFTFRSSSSNEFDEREKHFSDFCDESGFIFLDELKELEDKVIKDIIDKVDNQIIDLDIDKLLDYYKECRKDLKTNMNLILRFYGSSIYSIRNEMHNTYYFEKQVESIKGNIEDIIEGIESVSESISDLSTDILDSKN